MFQKHLKTFAITNYILISLELINSTTFVFTASSWLTFTFMADEFESEVQEIMKNVKMSF